MEMQMLQTMQISKLSGQQSSFDSLDLSEGKGKAGFLQLLGKAMSEETTDGDALDAEGETSVNELLAAFFSEGDQLLAEFADELKGLFKDESFEWSDELHDIIERLPQQMQIMAETLTKLDGDKIAAMVKETLSGTSLSKFPELLQEFLGDNGNTEVADKLENMNEEEQAFASSLTGLLAILNQTQQSNNGIVGNMGDKKQLSADFSGMLTSLANSFLPASSKQTDTANPQKMLEQLSRWIENQAGQQNQTKSIEALTQQWKKDVSSDTAAKHNYLQQLLDRGLSPSDSSASKTQSAPQATTQDATGVMAKAQQALLHLGEGKTEQARSQEFLKQFQDLIGKSNLQSFKNGTQQLTLKLHPEYLGRLDVKLTQQNGQMTAQLLTTTKTARDMVESQIQQLRTTFQQQNIQVDRIDIEQQPSYLQQDSQNKEQQTAEQFFDQQEQIDEEEKETFGELLEELTFNKQV